MADETIYWRERAEQAEKDARSSERMFWLMVGCFAVFALLPRLPAILAKLSEADLG